MESVEEHGHSLEKHGHSIEDHGHSLEKRRADLDIDEEEERQIQELIDEVRPSGIPQLWNFKCNFSQFLILHPWLESILGLDFNQHGKTLYYSILYPFCYTVGVSRLL